MKAKVSPNTKFSKQDIWDIQMAYGKQTARELSDWYQCGPETIRKIWRGETFRHLTHGGIGEGEKPKFLPPSPLEAEPSAEEVEESQAILARLLKVQEEKNNRGDQMLEELAETPDWLRKMGEKGAELREDRKPEERGEEK
ncbi:MAG: hypothetical protein KGL39_09935 [Patescibacteria group bacterium]|nr:hypothetical protein [Patescibacteria group bacterium]